MEYREELGKEIYFCKDSLRNKKVHLSFMELNTESQRNSRLFLKVTSGVNLISANQ
jgi:hypothetical protein